MIRIAVPMLFACCVCALSLGVLFGQLVTITRVQTTCQHEGHFEYVNRILTGPITIECKEMKK